MGKWNRTPKHILRMNCAKHVIAGWKPSTFLEVGAGTGDFTRLFLERGYTGVCYDLGEENRKILRENLKEYGRRLTVVDSLADIRGERFDYLFSFEVLEHIEDDLGALSEWTSCLKPKGRALISVPAHVRKYTKDDKLMGHVRRYDKKDLYSLLESAGYENIKILNYGFPLGNISRIVATALFGFLSGGEEGLSGLSPEERSVKSGVERYKNVHRLSFLFNDFFIAPFIFIQKLFFNADLGDGYMACAEKRD